MDPEPDPGDHEAAPDDPVERFHALYTNHVRGLLGYAARRLDRPEEAADVVAEVFTVAWRRIGEVPADPEARPWLFGVARNVVANNRRGEGRRHRLADRLRAELAVLPATAEPPTGTRLDLQRALARLSEDDRELLLLTVWEGLSPAELAVVFGLPAGTVRSRLHRVRRQLRRQLDPAGEAMPAAIGRPGDPPASAAPSTGMAGERRATAGQVTSGGGNHPAGTERLP